MSIDIFELFSVYICNLNIPEIFNLNSLLHKQNKFLFSYYLKHLSFIYLSSEVWKTLNKMKIVIMYVGDRLTIHFLLKNPRVSKKQQVKHPHLYCSGLVFETFFSIIENKYKFAFFTGNVFEARKFVRKVPQIDK